MRFCQYLGSRPNTLPSFRQAMSGPEAAQWREACESEMANLERYGVYRPVPEDSLPSWDPVKKRARELVRGPDLTRLTPGSTEFLTGLSPCWKL